LAALLFRLYVVSRLFKFVYQLVNIRNRSHSDVAYERRKLLITFGQRRRKLLRVAEIQDFLFDDVGCCDRREIRQSKFHGIGRIRFPFVPTKFIRSSKAMTSATSPTQAPVCAPAPWPAMH